MLLSTRSSALWAYTFIFRGLKLIILLQLVKFIVLYFYDKFISLMHYRAVPIAMDRAIKEIVSGIVQRSVSIATQTTKELVLKVCQ
jgi:hypothetical protein